jgi:hypothetical protein
MDMRHLRLASKFSVLTLSCLTIVFAFNLTSAQEAGSTDEVCLAALTQAFEGTASTACADTDPNTLCYGSGEVSASLGEASLADGFQQPGDELSLSSVQSIVTAPSSPNVQDTTSVAYINILTDAGAELDLAVLAGTQIENTGENFESFNLLDTSSTTSSCGEFEDMVFVDSLTDWAIIEVSGVPIQLAPGTRVAMWMEPEGLNLITISEVATLFPDTENETIVPLGFAAVPSNETVLDKHNTALSRSLTLPTALAYQTRTLWTVLPAERLDRFLRVRWLSERIVFRFDRDHVIACRTNPPRAPRPSGFDVSSEVIVRRDCAVNALRECVRAYGTRNDRICAILRRAIRNDTFRG